MSFTVHRVEQKSPEWYALRAGLVTGSCAQAIIQERKKGTGELAIRRDLRHRLVAERLTGHSSDEPWTSDDMQRGVDLEAGAFAAYEAETGHCLTRVGFVTHDALMAGCSPDGVYGNWEGVVELKCPKSTTHLDYLRAGVLPEEYQGQVIHTLWLTGAPWVDFCSFHPQFPPPMHLFRIRVHEGDVDLTAYELALRLFLSEVERDVEAVRARCAPSAGVWA